MTAAGSPSASTTGRVPASAGLATLALGASLLVHAGGLVWRGLPAPVEVAGSGGGEVALEGTAFADLAAGVTSAAPAETAVIPPVERLDSGAEPPTTPPVEPDRANTPEPEAAPPVEAHRVAPAAAAATETASADVAEAVRTRPVRAERAVTSAEAPTPRIAPAETVRDAGRPVAETTATVTPTETVAAVSEDEGPALRPRARPPYFSAPPPETAQQAARSLPAPQGNASTSARRGATGGSAAGRATSSGRAASEAAGNAAASNYPGLVQQQIARQRLPRVRSSGTVHVSFSISPAGGLASLSVAASSGDARFDYAALDLVRRAAPFPAPPPGAQRSFTLPVLSR